MFDESPNSKKIWDFFDKKYGQLIAPVGLAKCCAVVSSKFQKYPRCSVFVVAPTRQFKTQTTKDMASILSKSHYIELGSDFTIHSIIKEYGNKIDKKCLLVNDATLLFSSKSKRTKDRLINALAELISDGVYKYGERMERLIVSGRISVIMNITFESYSKYEDKLLGSTFLERFITLFYRMPLKEQREYMENKQELFNKNPYKFGKKISVRIKKIENTSEYKKIMVDYANTISALSVKSPIGTFDSINALVKSHCNLNNRNYICDDEIHFLKSLIPYTLNPFAPNEGKIIELRRQRRTYKDICLLLDKEPKSYKPYVSKVVRKAQERGVLS